MSSKCPLIAAYISGAQFSALVYHNSTVTNVPTQDRNQETNIQMVVKLSSKLHLPVLQAGLFSVVSKIGDTVDAATPDPVDPLSLLDFSLRLPEHDTRCQRVVHIVEAGLRHTSAMLTAKIVQSEWSTNPVLLWHQLTTRRRPSTYAQPEPSQDELSTNSIAVNVRLPSVALRFNGPPKASPTLESLLLDPSLVAEVVDAWKPRVANLVTSVKSLLENKRCADRRMLLSLLSSGLETAASIKVSVQLCGSIMYMYVCVIFSAISLHA